MMLVTFGDVGDVDVTCSLKLEGAPACGGPGQS